MLNAQPSFPPSLGEILKEALSGQAGRYNLLRGAVAFVKESGLRHLQDALSEFMNQGGEIRLVVGIDHRGTSIEALRNLLDRVGPNGQVLINHDEAPYVTFHPKLYLLEGPSHALIVVGSGNLTEGGLYTNDEAFFAIELDKSDPSSVETLRRAHAALDSWSDPSNGTVRELSDQLITSLANQGYALPEREASAEDEAVQTPRPPQPDGGEGPLVPLFRRGPARPRPMRPRPEPVADTTPQGIPRGFAMTLMRTDVGTGQVTPGTAARSPEVFIPLGARDLHPEFWQWPDGFTEDPTHPEKRDRWNVPVSIGGQIVQVNMMTWPDKHDFRLRSEALRSAGQEGDIMKIERVEGRPDVEYHVEIVPRGSRAHEELSRVCMNATPNSRRVWGYYD